MHKRKCALMLTLSFAVALLVSVGAPPARAADAAVDTQSAQATPKGKVLAQRSTTLWAKPAPTKGGIQPQQAFNAGNGQTLLYTSNCSVFGGPKIWGESKTVVSNNPINDPDVRGEFRKNGVVKDSRGNSREWFFDTASWTAQRYCENGANWTQKSWFTIWAGGSKVVDDFPETLTAYY